MAISTISIPVDEKTALAFSNASSEERRRLQVLLRLRLRELTTGPQRSLQEIMDEMSEQTQSRGLTPELLESILNER